MRLLLWHHIVGQHIRINISHVLVHHRILGKTLAVCVGDWGVVPWVGSGKHGGRGNRSCHWVHHCRGGQGRVGGDWCNWSILHYGVIAIGISSQFNWFYWLFFGNNPPFTEMKGQIGFRFWWWQIILHSGLFIEGNVFWVIWNCSFSRSWDRHCGWGYSVWDLHRRGGWYRRFGWCWGRWHRRCRLGWLERNDFPKEFSVSLRDCSWTINTHSVAVMRPNFYNHTCMIPLTRSISRLVLDSNTIPWP